MRSKFLLLILMLVFSCCFCTAQTTPARFNPGNVQQQNEEVEIYEEEIEAEEYYEEEYVEYEEESYIEVDEEINNPFIISNGTSSFREIDTSYKAKYRDKEHTYREKKEKKKKVEKPKKKSKPKDYNPAPLQMSGFAKVVFYVFLALALGLIIYLLVMSLKNFRIEKKAKLTKVEAHKEVEQVLAPIEELDPNDLKNLINKAIGEENFPQAIRYYFLLYLEKLEHHKYIVYNKDKTNADYLQELKQEDRIADFIKVSYLFEYVWYGKKAINKETFGILQKTFDHQINAIQ